MTKAQGDNPTISGHLGTIDVQDVMGFLGTLPGGGALEINSPDGEMVLYLEDGTIVGGDVIRDDKAPVSPDPERTGTERTGEGLAENLVRLFSWAPGEFRFFEGREPPPESSPVKIDIRTLLLESARRCEDWSHLPGIYHEADTRFRLRCEPHHDDGDVALDLDEWKVLFQVANRCRLGEIWEMSTLGSRLETSKTLFGLASARFVQPIGASPHESEATSSPSLGPPPPAPVMSRPLNAPTVQIEEEGLSSDEPDADTQPVLSKLAVTAERLRHEPPTAELATRRPADRDDPASVEPSLARRLTRSQVRIERKPNLVHLLSASESRVYELSGDKVTLGRAPDNHLVLPDRHVSGHHARIVRDGDGFEIEDTQSSNGIRVEGRNVRRARLEGGEEIEIYPYRFRFELAFEISESP